MGDRLFHNHTLELSWETVHKTIAGYLDANTDDDSDTERLSIFYDALFKLICGRKEKLSLNASVLIEITPYLTSNKWLIMKNRDRWKQVEEKLWQASINFRPETPNLFKVILSALSITAFLEGRVAALKKVVGTILHDQNLQVDARAIGELCSNKGWYQNLPSLTLNGIVDPNFVIRGSDSEIRIKVKRILDILAFKIDQRQDWLSEIVNEIILPIMKSALTQEKYQIALALESELCKVYLKSNETEEHYNSAIALWAPMMETAGRTFYRNLATPTNKNNVPKVGFFIHEASPLAHIQLMYSALEGASQISPRQFSAIVYIFNGYDEKLATNLDQIGVETVWLSQKVAPNELDRLIWLRKRMQRDQITACVWVSSTSYMAFAFSMRLAPTQIWWAAKFHPNCFNNVDGYITCHNTGDYNVQFFGREWQTVPIGFRDLYDNSLIEEARDLRNKFNRFDIVLGTLAREEKIAAPDFLSTIVEILKSNSNTIWLYTGRENHPMIQKYLDAANVRAQSQFIGWVNTKLYAQAIDIFADTWPLGSGLAGIQAMAYGKPYVFYHGYSTPEEGRKGLMGALGMPILQSDQENNSTTIKLNQIFKMSENEKLLLNANSPDEYAVMIKKLIRNSDFRKDCGNAYKEYVETLPANTALLGKRLGERISDIIEETKLRNLLP